MYMTVLFSMPLSALFATEKMDMETEYQIKSVFLYNFANFVEWPKSAFSDRQSPLRLCVYGDAPFGPFLDVVDGSRVKDRVLNVVKSNYYRDVEPGCHILFVSENKKNELPKFIGNEKYQYILSVGDMSGFTKQGGVINIVRNFDQLELEINLRNALKNNLTISSDLLDLAKVVDYE